MPRRAILALTLALTVGGAAAACNSTPASTPLTPTVAPPTTAPSESAPSSEAPSESAPSSEAPSASASY